jgi:hypothetical protein
MYCASVTNAVESLQIELLTWTLLVLEFALYPLTRFRRQSRRLVNVIIGFAQAMFADSFA